MENLQNSLYKPKPVNYYATIQKYLKKQYADIDNTTTNALCREVVFAPENYATEINDAPVPISHVRESLADFIERDNANKNFIPYSLDAAIADLIEKNNCETSSMNEYYRWISATADIVRDTTDGEVTEKDASSRQSFITMSFDREAEILLCLALYQGAGAAKNKEKINLLRFKLARLREMRSIVSGTPGNVTVKTPEEKQKLHRYYEYCLMLLAEKNDFSQNFNLKLKLNINHSIDEDLEEDYSYLNYLRQVILHMMHKLEKASDENQHSENSEEKGKTLTPGLGFSSFREAEGR